LAAVRSVGAILSGPGEGVVDVAVGVTAPTGREKMSPAGGGFGSAPPKGFTLSDGGFVNVIVGGFGKEDPLAIDWEVTPPFVLLLIPVRAGGGVNVDVAKTGGLENGDAGVVVVVTAGRENKVVASCRHGEALGDGYGVAVATGATVGAFPNDPPGGGGNP
jgi:hypothetical protein